MGFRNSKAPGAEGSSIANIGTPTLTFLEQEDMLKLHYSDGTEVTNDPIL